MAENEGSRGSDTDPFQDKPLATEYCAWQEKTAHDTNASSRFPSIRDNRLKTHSLEPISPGLEAGVPSGLDVTNLEQRDVYSHVTVNLLFIQLFNLASQDSGSYSTCWNASTVLVLVFLQLH